MWPWFSWHGLQWKMLQMVSSHLPNKAAQTATGTVGWIFLTALKVNMDLVLCDATPVHNVQRCLEELEQCIVALEKNPMALKNPVTLTVRRLLTVMVDVIRLQVPAWQQGSLCSRKWSMSSLWSRGDILKGPQGDWVHDTSTIYSGEVGQLGYAISEKERGSLAAWLLRLWDTGVDSTLYSRDQIEWLASITIHPSLRQSLQNVKWPMQGLRNQTYTPVEWINTAICNMWSNTRELLDTVSKWHT